MSTERKRDVHKAIIMKCLMIENMFMTIEPWFSQKETKKSYLRQKLKVAWEEIINEEVEQAIQRKSTFDQ